MRLPRRNVRATWPGKMKIRNRGQGLFLRCEQCGCDGPRVHPTGNMEVTEAICEQVLKGTGWGIVDSPEIQFLCPKCCESMRTGFVKRL
jgi:hypothetical protein